MEKARILDKLIKETGMSVRAFAEKCGLPESTVYTILKNGAGKANVNNVIAMCRTLGITVEQLDDMSKVLQLNSEQASRITSYYDFLMKVTNTERSIVNSYRKADDIDKAIVLRTLHIDENIQEETINKPKKTKYIPTEEDIRSLVARNGRKLTREEAIEFISEMYSDDEED